MFWHEAQFLSDFFRRYMIGTVIIRRRGNNIDIRSDYAANHFSNLDHPVVLIAGIEGFAIDGVIGPFERLDIQLSHILNVDIGTLLLPAKNSNLPVVNRLIGEDVYR